MINKRIAVTNSTDQAELSKLAANEAVTLDVTALDLGRLPEHVKAELHTKAQTFNAPQLQTAGHIYAARATSFDAPQLQTAKDIEATSAMSFAAPRLQTGGHIDAASATSFDAPQLQTSENIYAPSATSFSVLQLQTAGDIHAPKAATPERPGTIGRPPSTSIELWS